MFIILLIFNFLFLWINIILIFLFLFIFLFYFLIGFFIFIIIYIFLQLFIIIFFHFGLFILFIFYLYFFFFFLNNLLANRVTLLNCLINSTTSKPRAAHHLTDKWLLLFNRFNRRRFQYISNFITIWTHHWINLIVILINITINNI